MEEHSLFWAEAAAVGVNFLPTKIKWELLLSFTTFRFLKSNVFVMRTRAEFLSEQKFYNRTAR